MAANQTEADALFRKVESGWIFRAPNPRIFGDAPHYLVSDEQKALIVQIVNPRHPIRLGIYVGLAIVAWVLVLCGIMWMADIDADKASGAVYAVFVAAIVVPMLALLPLTGALQLRRLRPVLSAAQVSDERITLQEVGAGLKSTYTCKKALTFAGLWTFTGVMQLLTLAIRQGRHPLFGDAQSFMSVFTLVVALALAAKFVLIALKSEASVNPPAGSRT